MLKRILLTTGIVLVLLALFGPGSAANDQAIALESPALSVQAGAADGVDWLVNGDMDDVGFYFRPPNHFVAGMWFEWFAIDLPEFLDGGISYHNECYPRPATTCEQENNHSQGYIKWGASFAAGIYQPVQVTPCTYYRFEAYNRNDAWNYHPKVGIDPTGADLPFPATPDNPPFNCPPDGVSPCPNPSLGHPSQLPATIVWSPEFDHEPFTWAAQAVTAEALSTTVTVWTFAWPESAAGPSYSVYWDETSLVQAPPPTGLIVSPGLLPPPDGAIQDVDSAALIDTVTFEWHTDQPAVSQLLYHYVGQAGSALPSVVTSTQQFELKSDVVADLRTTHSIQLHGLTPGSVYDVALLSRQWTGSQCQTSVYVTRFTMPEMLIDAGPLPSADGHISNVTSTPIFDSAALEWQTSEPAYSQLLYHYVGPASNTVLPPKANHTQQYEMKSGIVPAALTTHALKLKALLPVSVYDVAILACRLVDNRCQTSVYVTRFETTDMLVPAGQLPDPSQAIVGPIILPSEQSAYVVWQSPQPAYAQVLYHYSHPVTFTIPPSLTHRLYLPLVASTNTRSGSTTDYEFRTWPITEPTTLHVVQLTGLRPNSWYAAVALSTWNEGEQVAVSKNAMFRTGPALTRAAAAHPQQLAKQLQACLADGRPLAACVDEAH